MDSQFRNSSIFKRVSAVVLAFGLVFGIGFGRATVAQAAQGTVSLTATQSSAYVGDSIPFQLKAECAGGGTASVDCGATAVEVQLPKTSSGSQTHPGLGSVVVPDGWTVDSWGVSSTKLTFRTTNMTAGSATTFQLSVLVTNGEGYTGDTLTATATMSSPNVTTATATSNTVTLKTVNELAVKTTSSAFTAEPVLNSDVKYEVLPGWKITSKSGLVSYLFPGDSTTPSNVSYFHDLTITATIPAGAIVKSISDSGVQSSNTITWKLASMEAVPAKKFSYVLNYPSGAFTADGDINNPSDNVTLGSSVTGKPYGQTADQTASAESSHGFANKINYEGFAGKGLDYTTVQGRNYMTPGEISDDYRDMLLEAENTSPVAMKLNMTDVLPCNFTTPTDGSTGCPTPSLVSIRLLTDTYLANNVFAGATVKYTTNKGNTGNVTLIGNANLAPNPYPWDPAVGETITKIELVDFEMPAQSKGRLRIRFQVNPALPASAAGTVYENKSISTSDPSRLFIENCMHNATLTGADGTVIKADPRPGNSACGYAIVTPPYPQMKTSKAMGQALGQSFKPGEIVPVTITVTSTASNYPFIPAVLDVLPPELELIDGSVTATAPTGQLDSANFKTAVDGNKIRAWWDGGVTATQKGLLKGSNAVIKFNVRVRPGTLPKSYTNNMFALDTAYKAGSKPNMCGGLTLPDSNDVDNDKDTSEYTCLSSATFTVAQLSEMKIIKGVKGSEDADFHVATEANPKPVGLVLPGKPAQYQIEVKNSGNSELKNVVIYDVLPFPGDSHTASTDARGSDWKPTLTAPVTAAGATVYYSVSDKPCRPELLAVPGCVDDWTTTVPALVDVKALKLVYADPMVGGTSKSFTVSMEAPADAAGVAWNSAAAAAKDGAGWEFKITPNVVGLTVPISLSLKKELTPVPDRFGVGDEVTFTVRATNGGPAPAVNVTVKDVLPAGLSFVSATPSSGTYDNATGKWVFGTTKDTWLGVGQTADLVVKAKIKAGTEGTTITNTATVQKSDQVDTLLGTGSSTASVSFVVGYTVGDLIFADANANGKHDAGEKGISGVKVSAEYLLNGTTVALPDVISDSAGKYQFTGIPAGTKVTVTVDGSGPVADLVQTAGPATPLALTATVDHISNSSLGLDFGFVAPGSISGLAWLDLNGDGVKDADEPVLANVPIKVEYSDPATGLAATPITVTTGSDGAYSIPKLLPSTYKLTATPLAGYSVSSTNPISVALAAGAEEKPHDFAFVGVGAVAGVVFHDVNGQAGHEPGEPGLANVGVSINWFGLDGVAGGGDDHVYQVQTDSDGKYRVSNLPPGTYEVLVDRTTVPNAYDQQTVDPDDVKDDKTEVTISASAMVVDGQDFGYTALADLSLTKTVAVAGSVTPGATVTYTITVKNAGPSVASSVKVLDKLPDGITFDSASGAGSYDAASGVWSVGQIGKDGSAELVVKAKIAAGTEGKTIINTAEVSESAEFDATSTPGNGVAGEDDQASASLNVGFTVLGHVYNDFNADGTMSGSDTGVEGVKVMATYKDSDGKDVSVEATTGADGGYVFPGIVAASVAITVDQTGVLAGTTQTGRPASATAFDNTATVDLTSNATGVDFGYVKSGSVSGVVKFDVDGDGVVGAAEPVAAGVTVNLTGKDPVTGAAIEKTAVTDEFGAYSFPGLLPGVYSVTVTPLAGTSVSTGDPVSVSLKADGSGTADFGLKGSGSVVGSVFEDTNGDGAQGSGESGIVAASVALVWAGPNGVLGDGDDVSVTLPVAADGVWSKADVLPGKYSVTVLGVPAVLDQVTADPDGAMDGKSEFVVAAGAAVTGKDFGFATLSDLVVAKTAVEVPKWKEPGAQVVYQVTVTNKGPSVATNVKVSDKLPDTLVFVSADPVADYDAVTGLWSVGDLAKDASAVLKVTAKIAEGAEGTTIKNTAVGTSDGFDPDDGNSSADDDLTVGFTVSSVVFVDANVNGVLDGSEAGVPGVKVSLIGTDGTVLQSVVTDAEGRFKFGGIPVNTVVRVVVDTAGPVAGMLQTADPDGSLDSETSFTVSKNETGKDFGYVKSGSVSGVVEADPNANDVSGKPMIPLPGVTVKLTGKDPVTGAAIEKTAVTDENGAYSFPGLLPGGYTVTVQTPDGMSGTGSKPSAVTPDGTTTVSFVFKGVGVIGDLVWHDRNANGVVDSGEPGLPGVKVSALWFGMDGTEGTSDDVVYDPLTDADGKYQFTDLLPGEYRVWVEKDSVPAHLDQITGDPDTTKDAISLVTITAANGTNRDQDFGFAAIADVAIEKTGTVTATKPGGKVEYLVTVTNNGPSEASDIVVVENLPEGLGGVSVVPESGTWDAATSRWTIPTLANGASTTLTVTGTILPSAAGKQIINNVTIESTGSHDPNPDDNEYAVGFDVDNSDKPKTAKKLPKTGFDVGPWGWAASSLLLAAGIAMLISRRRTN